MPEQQTLDRARKDAREGKSPSTQAGEFVREEIHHIREGKHGARSPQKAIAIGLSKARRAGVKLALPKGSPALKKKAAQDERAGKHPHRKTSKTRARATERYNVSRAPPRVKSLSPGKPRTQRANGTSRRAVKQRRKPRALAKLIPDRGRGRPHTAETVRSRPDCLSEQPT
jgi:hypothetical protein